MVASYHEIAEFLTLLTFSKDQSDEAGDLTEVPKATPLISWNVDDWKAASDAIKAIHERLIRQDAPYTLEELKKEGEDEQQNFEVAGHSAFSTSLYKLLKFFTFHSYLSPFRPTLEQRIKECTGKEEQFKPLVISDEFLGKYR